MFNLALTIMQTEIDNKNNVFLQEGKRVKYSQGIREGPDKGLSPNRDETQVIRDRTEAEKTGEKTCGNIKDMLSMTDTQEELISFQWLQGAAHIDLSTIQTVTDKDYVGPEDLVFTMNSVYEQYRGVRELYETQGIIMQPPNMLSKVAATNPAMAKAEKWWLHTWEHVRNLPEHAGGGYIEGSRRVYTVSIKTSEQNAYQREQENKNLLFQQTQAQEKTNRANQKRANEENQFAPVGKVNLLRPFSKENWANTPT
jgi:hypothetical protein